MSYGVSFVHIRETIDSVITAPYCINKTSSFVALLSHCIGDKLASLFRQLNAMGRLWCKIVRARFISSHYLYSVRTCIYKHPLISVARVSLVSHNGRIIVFNDMDKSVGIPSLVEFSHCLYFLIIFFLVVESSYNSYWCVDVKDLIVKQHFGRSSSLIQILDGFLQLSLALDTKGAYLMVFLTSY